MSLVPCAACAYKEGEIRQEARKASRSHEQDRPIQRQRHLDVIATLKDDLAQCAERGHLSMANGRAASVERHARGRQERRERYP